MRGALQRRTERKVFLEKILPMHQSAYKAVHGAENADYFRLSGIAGGWTCLVVLPTVKLFGYCSLPVFSGHPMRPVFMLNLTELEPVPVRPYAL